MSDVNYSVRSGQSNCRRILPYAPALAAAGVDVSRVLLVHPKNHQEQLWATEQALEVVRQIQLHKVTLHRRHAASGLTTLTPEQRDLFETVGLPAPRSAAL